MNMENCDLNESFKIEFRQLGVSVRKVIVYMYEIKVETNNHFFKISDVDKLREISGWLLDMIYPSPYGLVFTYKQK